MSIHHPDSSVTEDLSFTNPIVSGPPSRRASWESNSAFSPQDGSAIEDQAGRTVGPYLLLERLGSGSQGEVWRAFLKDPISRVLALKVRPLRGEVVDDAALALRREAEKLANLSDPAILPLLDYGIADGTVYLAMPLVQGCSLEELITQRFRRVSGRSIPQGHRWAFESDRDYLRHVIGAILRVARALDSAHQSGIVHHDIKPSNVLLDHDDGEMVYLSDFGLAAPLSPSRGLVQRMIGTSIFMAPEVLRGDSARDDRLSDLYSLGLTLYEATTLERPFKVPDNLPWNERTRWLLNELPPRPRSFNPAISLDLEMVILKAIHPEANQRYRGAGEFADELQRLLNGEFVIARPAGHLRRLLRTVHQARLALLVITTLLLAVSLGLVLTQTAKAQKQRELSNLLSMSDERALNGQMEDAVSLALKARSDYPEDPRVTSRLERLRQPFLDEAKDAVDSGQVGRVQRMRDTWHDWMRSRSSELDSLDQLLGIAPLEVVSEPAGAEITFVGVHSDGRPKVGRLYHLEAGSISHPQLLPAVIPGRYWVTASHDNRWVERPFRMEQVSGKSEGDHDEEPRGLRLTLYPQSSERPSDEMVYVPGGRLMMGSDRNPVNFEYPRHPKEVAPFFLDATEVTNGQYLEFLKATRGAAKAFDFKIWPGNAREGANASKLEGDPVATEGYGLPESARLDWPVTNVTIAKATEYAAWRGCRLPTEEELEWAARGTEGLIGPRDLPLQWRDLKDDWLSLHDVRKVPADRSPIGNAMIHGLYGNASEITLFEFRYYPGSTSQREQLAVGTQVIRCGLVTQGGAKDPMSLGYIRRAILLSNAQHPLVGFRCARSLEPWRGR